jgi:L-rhamnose isomerase
MNSERIEQDFKAAKIFYEDNGIDIDEVFKRLEWFSISIQCWQGDDVGGFETPHSNLSGGGIQVTGNYPGKARNIHELKQDLLKALSLIPGNHRINLHAIYGDFGGKKLERDEIEPQHFQTWVEWARENNLGLDFNATCFSHPRADDGFTLSSRDKATREFWIEHVKKARKITAFLGREFQKTAVHNLWIPDGSKDIPYDRWTPRRLLKESLDEIYSDQYDSSEMKDAMESKLFGIGSEAYVVGSHEFYLGYALKNNLMVCLDMGHFHPMENVSDKISSVLQFSDELLFHISRGVRWDSDHIPIFNDELQDVASQIIRNDLENRIYIAMDFFDATLNRVGAYVLGVRSLLKSLLAAMLEPQRQLVSSENNNDKLSRLAWLEESRMQPLGAIWNYYCQMHDVPPVNQWLTEVKNYEDEIQSKRS